LPTGDEYFRSLDASPINWYKGAYSHLYILRCEDAETYKNTMRPRLRAWVEERTDQGHEWMILYMPLGAKSTSRGLSGREKSRVREEENEGSKRKQNLKCDIH
jgi:hypothetical protein